jgi:glycosyltransferase involved in cell wall biosynthesis
VEKFVRSDSRVRLIRHGRNRGFCPARNTAAAAARGEWLVQLDSDQALRPGTLTTLKRLTAAAPADVGNVAGRVVWDTGIVTPTPSLAPGPLGYEKYVAWADTLDIGEYFNCIRRRVWCEGIRWPETRAGETNFHLDLVAKWRFEIHAEICSIYYTDADNRITGPRDPAYAKHKMMEESRDRADDAVAMLRNHGRVLGKHGPKLLRIANYQAALYAFLAGRRAAGLKYWLQCIKGRPCSPRLWALLFLGFAGPGVLRDAYCWAKRACPATLQVFQRVKLSLTAKPAITSVRDR